MLQTHDNAPSLISRLYLALIVIGLLTIVIEPAPSYEGWIGTLTYQDHFIMGMKTEGLRGEPECTEIRDVEIQVDACFNIAGGPALSFFNNVLSYSHTHRERRRFRAEYEICCGADRSIPIAGANVRHRDEGCERGLGKSA